MKTRRILLGALLAGAAAVAVLAGACVNSWSPDPGATGKLRVSFGVEGHPLVDRAARTVVPVWDPTPFVKYMLSVAKTSGGADYEPVDISAGGTVDLAPGTYTITVTAYTAGDTAAAEGTKAGVVIAQGETALETITLEIKTGGAAGAFSYDLTLPAGLNSAALVVTTLTDGAVDNGTVPLTAGQQNTGTIALDPGHYYARLELRKGTQSAGFRNEAIHIYTGLTSALPARTYGEADFPGDKTVTLLDLTGVCPAPVGGASPVTAIDAPGGQYTGTIAWKAGGSEHTGNFTAGTVYTAELSLAAATGYTFEGVEEDAFSYDSATLVTNPENSGAVTIVFEEAEAGSGSGPVTVGPVSAADLAALLASDAVPVGTPEAPTTVILSSFDVTGSSWGTTVKTALTGVQKYITLDLTACTTSGNSYKIVGDSAPSGNHFNIIRSDYVVGIILPQDLVEISTSAFRGWGIRYITITSSLITIGTNSFYGTTQLKSIDLPNSVTTIKSAAFQDSGLTSITIPELVANINVGTFDPCPLTSVTFAGNITNVKSGAFEGDLYTVYTAADPKAGTYTRSGAAWTKQ
jgi:hypothetical protein